VSQEPKRQAAFFDVDYTLISNNSMLLYLKYARKNGIYTAWDMARGTYKLILYQFGFLGLERAIDEAGEKYRGMPVEKLRSLCDSWYDEVVKDYIYPEALALLEDHRKSGHELALLTATTDYLTLPMSKHLNIKYYYSNRMEVDNGLLTGRLVKPMCHGDGKLEYAKGFEQETGISLKDCYYYSDSISDLNTLNGFGHPVAVNPDPKLRTEALARGWKIIDFQKMPAAHREKGGRKDIVRIK
jgi:HAD superfamily hydrolase (TIGR01490 family)